MFLNNWRTQFNVHFVFRSWTEDLFLLLQTAFEYLHICVNDSLLFVLSLFCALTRVDTWYLIEKKIPLWGIDFLDSRLSKYNYIPFGGRQFSSDHLLDIIFPKDYLRLFAFALNHYTLQRTDRFPSESQAMRAAY